MKDLLDRHAPINQSNQYGSYPIHYALDRPEVLRLLLDRQEVDVNARNKDGHTALMLTIDHFPGDRKEAFDLLLEKRNDPDIKKRTDLNAKDKDGDTALILAIHGGDLDKARALIDAGSDLNIRGSAGYTALHWAAQRGFPELVRQLRAAGADPDIRTNAGDTVLELARGFSSGPGQIVPILEEAAKQQQQLTMPTRQPQPPKL
ncbi:MAG: ankyrin repeat domain-containing protein [Proteobacteria bacterium]|nr:ankyrin repeat domain-containing protein [Pseudomonadota bacterium]